MKRASGFGMGVVVSILLIAVIVVIFFFPFLGMVSDLFTKTGDEAACRISLMGAHASAKCFQQAKILKDKAEINGKKFIEKGPEGTQNMAKEVLAKLLTMCLSKGGGYNSRSFSPENWLEEESVCLQCYKVTFDEGVGAISGFTDYLTSTKPKNSVQDKKYIEALTRDPEHLKAYMEYGMGFGLSPSKGTFEFNPNEEYTVFFIGLKKGYFLTTTKRLWQAATGDFLKAAFGNQDAYFSYIVESNKIGQVCDRLVN